MAGGWHGGIAVGMRGQAERKEKGGGRVGGGAWTWVPPHVGAEVGEGAFWGGFGAVCGRGAAGCGWGLAARAPTPRRTAGPPRPLQKCAQHRALLGG